MKHLLMAAKDEIISLRRQNEILRAQMAVVEVFSAALGLKYTGGGMSLDIALELQRKIDELNAPQVKP